MGDKQKDYREEKIKFRTLFAEKLSAVDNKVTLARTLSELMPKDDSPKLSTLRSWYRKTAKPLPDIWRNTFLARAMDVSPAWLAFDQGPRSVEASEKAAEWGKLIDGDADLQAKIDGFIAGVQAVRASLVKTHSTPAVESPVSVVSAPHASKEPPKTKLHYVTHDHLLEDADESKRLKRGVKKSRRKGGPAKP
jgi:hypothetical protein